MINRYTFAGLLAVLAVVGIFVLGALVLGGGSEPDALGDRPSDTAAADVAAPAPTEPKATATKTPAKDADSNSTGLPKQKTKDLAEAARAAGCTVTEEVDEGAEHVDRVTTAADYGTN